MLLPLLFIQRLEAEPQLSSPVHGVRNLQVLLLYHWVTPPVALMLSHDWMKQLKVIKTKNNY